MTEGVNIPPQGCLHECLAYLVAIIVTVILMARRFVPFL